MADVSVEVKNSQMIRTINTIYSDLRKGVVGIEVTNETRERIKSSLMIKLPWNVTVSVSEDLNPPPVYSLGCVVAKVTWEDSYAYLVFGDSAKNISYIRSIYNKL